MSIYLTLHVNIAGASRCVQESSFSQRISWSMQTCKLTNLQTYKAKTLASLDKQTRYCHNWGRARHIHGSSNCILVWTKKSTKLCSEGEASGSNQIYPHNPHQTPTYRNLSYCGCFPTFCKSITKACMKWRALYRNVAGFLEDFCASLAHLLIPTSLVLPIPTSWVVLPICHKSSFANPRKLPRAKF